jgi:hypothetical protein
LILCNYFSFGAFSKYWVRGQESRQWLCAEATKKEAEKAEKFLAVWRAGKIEILAIWDPNEKGG